ncbi:MAG: cell division protein FtsQ [Bacteroidales bacterium]|nr:cell division protein FtsQ [Labilibaculum sp.]PCH70875.1 MAG: cell division protein FtsQ [Bacteroidales bacterium]
MLKKVANILVWVCLFVYLIVVFSFVNGKSEKLVISGTSVNVVDSVKRGFVRDADVERIIKKKYPEIVGAAVSGINKEILEDLIDKLPYVKKSEVYNSLSGKLIIDIKQRNPIVRILAGNGYYIDAEGKKMPLSTNFTSRVLVVSGAVNDQLIKEELFELVKFITNDEFWKSQITQIYVDKNKEYILIPRVGAHKIELGSIENYERKFQKLSALYTKGFSKKGWNTYTKINLKYKDQVVCTKKN